MSFSPIKRTMGMTMGAQQVTDAEKEYQDWHNKYHPVDLRPVDWQVLARDFADDSDNLQILVRPASSEPVVPITYRWVDNEGVERVSTQYGTPPRGRMLSEETLYVPNPYGRPEDYISVRVPRSSIELQPDIEVTYIMDAQSQIEQQTTTERTPQPRNGTEEDE